MRYTRHYQHVSARFSAAARTYTDVSTLQDVVARRVLDLVPDDVRADAVLDAGCGAGRLLGLAGLRWPEAQMTGVDIAPGMIREARRLFAGRPRFHWVEADIQHYRPDQPCDLVLSSSALHWLRPFERGLSHLASLGRKGALLAIGIMLDGTLAELREARRAAAPQKPAGGRLPSLAQFEAAARSIPRARIRRIEQTRSEYDQPCASELLRSLHDMGVTGGDVSQAHTPLTRRELTALCDWYDAHFASPEGVRVTFEVGYLLLEV